VQGNEGESDIACCDGIIRERIAIQAIPREKGKASINKLAEPEPYTIIPHSIMTGLVPVVRCRSAFSPTLERDHPPSRSRVLALDDVR